MDGVEGGSRFGNRDASGFSVSVIYIQYVIEKAIDFAIIMGVKLVCLSECF